MPNGLNLPILNGLMPLPIPPKPPKPPLLNGLNGPCPRPKACGATAKAAADAGSKARNAADGLTAGLKICSVGLPEVNAATGFVAASAAIGLSGASWLIGSTKMLAGDENATSHVTSFKAATDTATNTCRQQLQARAQLQG